MASKSYIQFPSVVGDSKDRLHLGWFDVRSWVISGQHPGQGTFAVMISNVQGAADLLRALTIGKSFGKVTFDTSRTNGSLFLRYEFKEVLVETYQDVRDNDVHVSFTFESLNAVHKLAIGN